MSSSEGIPVEVTYVGTGPGTMRVPVGDDACFEVTRLLNEDIGREKSVKSFRNGRDGW